MKHYNLKGTLLLLLFVFSCKQITQPIDSELRIYSPNEIDISEFKTLDFKNYSIKVPNNWKKNEVKGIDSYVTELITSELDTISSDLGMYSNSLEPSETLPSFISKEEYESMSTTELTEFQKTEFIIYEDWNKIKLKDYMQTTEEFYSIYGYKARIVKPKESGKSYTGVYIENLWKTNGQPIHFNLYGYNLSKKTEKELLHSISTLKFKK